MNTLHIINKSAIKDSANQDCLRVIGDDDGLLLIEDAVYLCENRDIYKNKHPVYALQHDLHQRGLSISHNDIKIINDDDFVELCTEYKKTISWF